MSKRYTDSEYQTLCTLKEKVLTNRSRYFECFDSYFNFQLKLGDKYSINEIDKLIDVDYVSWEKLKNLYHNMLLARANYESSLRELYNYKSVLRFDSSDITFITDLRNGVRNDLLDSRRQYKGVK